MATISNTPRPGYVFDVTDNVWYPIGTGSHNHSEIASTIVDAKGDIIAATAADTPARLAVGADGTVLTAASGQATGLEWATPSSGGITLLSTTALSGVSVTLSSISQDYTNLLIIVENVRSTTANDCQVRMNSVTGNTKQAGFRNSNSTYISNLTTIALQADATDPETFALAVLVYRYASTTGVKPFNFIGFGNSGNGVNDFSGIVNTTSAITSIQIANGDGSPVSFNDGTVYLYGVK